VRVPQRISHDRYFLSLFMAPVCDPDLMLPGPVVQPEGGLAFYPNGFVEGDRMYVAYTYAGIRGSVIQPLPDFREPFLLPRGGRPGLRIEGRTAYFGQRQSTLGLVLNETLTKQDTLRLEFRVNVDCYSGGDFPILTLGGKTHNGGSLSAVYNAAAKSDVFQARLGGKQVDLGAFRMGQWNQVSVILSRKGTTIAVNGGKPAEFPTPVLRKICFGGLYVRPEWPMGMMRASEIRLDLDSITVQ
jgi:hypothetical protein